MSEANVELIRRSWDASLAGDWPGALATLDPDADIHDLYRVRDGLIVYMAYFNDQQQALEAARSGEQADD